MLNTRRQAADLARGIAGQLHVEFAAGDAVGGRDEAVERRDDRAAHPVGDGTHEQRQSRDQQQEELERT